MGNQKYKELFLTESREHLDAVLGALGAHATGAPLDIDELFRHFHSVKGMANAMDLGAAGSLAHAAEDLLAAARGGAPLDPAWSPLVQEAVESLQAMVDLFEDGGVPAEPADLARRLRAAIPAPSPGRSAAPVPSSAPSPAAFPEGYTVRVSIDPSSKMPSIRAFMLIKRIKDLGATVVSEPAEEALKAGGLRPAAVTLRVGGGIAREEIARAAAAVPELTVESMDVAAPAPEVKADTGVRRRRGLPVRVLPETLDRLQELAGELFIIQQEFEGHPAIRDDFKSADLLRTLNRAVRSLSETVTSARLVPLGLVTAQIPLRVRELAAKLGRDVRVEITGDEVGMDRAHVEKLEAPLMHIIRNSVDHGLEVPGARAAAGKSPQGVLRITARRSGRGVRIEIADDGRGIDPERIRDTAVARGVVTPERAVAMTQQELYDLICMPGFSTAREVTDVSGRGVGLDVVKHAITDMGGELGIQSTPGAGTTFSLDLPISYVQLHVMVVEASGSVFAVPVAQVAEVAEVGWHGLNLDAGRPFLKWRKGEVPVRSLAELLCLQADPVKGEFKFLILEFKGRHLAVRVDRLISEIEVVMRPPGVPLSLVPGFAGLTILGGGKPVIILDLITLAGASAFA